MPLGNKSIVKLSSCQPELRRLIKRVAEGVDRGDLRPLVEDITVLCGFRDEKEQEAAFASGLSTKRWPDSKHNVLPSMAVDAVPYPVDWKDTKAFEALRAYTQGVAAGMGIPLRVISWDWPHYELR